MRLSPTIWSVCAAVAAAGLLGACVPGGPRAVFTLQSILISFPLPLPFTNLARAADLAPDSAPVFPDAPWQPGNTLAVTLPTPAGTRTLIGTLRADALDGSLLLELADQRLEIVPSTPGRECRVLVAPPAAPSPRDVGRQILTELPPGFDLVVTKHYVICFDTSRAYAQWCGALFEKLHEAFANFWTQADFVLAEPPHPLIVVIFSDRQRYEAFASRDLGAAADRVVGYYNLLTNRVTTFDLTGSSLLPGHSTTSPGRAGLEILGSPEAAGLVATLVHEATHQMAYNGGMHQRLAPVPLWISEGIATYFETPAPGSGRGWQGIGQVNKPRLKKFLATYQPGALTAIIEGDEPFRAAAGALDAYAKAWALTAFLVQTRKPALVAYLRTLSAKPPLSDDTPAQRRAEFVAAFGVEPAEIEEPLLKFLARWK